MIILNGYASDLVNIYRTQGLNSVEIEIEKTLKSNVGLFLNVIIICIDWYAPWGKRRGRRGEIRARS